MAWLMQTKPLARYVPAMESTPSSQDLYKKRQEYFERNSSLYPFSTRDCMKQGVFLPEEYFPVSSKVKSSHKVLPDIINLEGYGVSERLKNIIEQFEPGVHQFHEVQVFMRDGTPADQRYFAMVAGHVTNDQVVASASPIGLSKIPNENGSYHINTPGIKDQRMIAIDRSKTQGWHLWHSWDIYRLMTISNEVQGAMVEAQILGQQYIELIEI